MRILVHDANHSFNPYLFTLYADGMKAITRRNAWLKSSWPLFKEKALPTNDSVTERERCEHQQVLMDSANRALSAMEAMLCGDKIASLTHQLDNYFVLCHKAAELETLRRATIRNSDVLLRQRAQIQANAGESSVDEAMLVFGKKEVNKDKFFQGGGGPEFSSSADPRIKPSPYPQLPSSPSLQSHLHSVSNPSRPKQRSKLVVKLRRTIWEKVVIVTSRLTHGGR
jgi:hypothetical protein